jgi:hypothetical protein
MPGGESEIERLNMKKQSRLSLASLLLILGLLALGLSFLSPHAMASPADHPTAPAAIESDGLPGDVSIDADHQVAAPEVADPAADRHVPGGVISIVAGLAALLFAAGFGRLDVGNRRTKALPNGAAATTCDAFDTGVTSSGVQPGDFEFRITAPALATGVMGDGKTMIYAAMMSDNADMSSPVVLYDRVVVQTGAGGAGAAATEGRFRLPSNAKRYIAVRATGSTTGDASASSFIMDPLF